MLATPGLWTLVTTLQTVSTRLWTPFETISDPLTSPTAPFKGQFPRQTHGTEQRLSCRLERQQNLFDLGVAHVVLALWLVFFAHQSWVHQLNPGTLIWERPLFEEGSFHWSIYQKCPSNHTGENADVLISKTTVCLYWKPLSCRLAWHESGAKSYFCLIITGLTMGWGPTFDTIWNVKNAAAQIGKYGQFSHFLQNGPVAVK